MKLKKFFKKLEQFYYDTVDGTGYACKYYLQMGTFSYELRFFGEVDENRIKDFVSDKNVVFKSEVYYDWNSRDSRKQIIKDIKEKAAELDEVRSSTKSEA